MHVIYFSVFFSVIFSVVKCYSEFPKGFKFGAATSSHQIEGGWNASDKTPTIWDVYTHTNKNSKGNADVACDSYHLWMEDVKIATELGLDYYRFSIAWPRILPTGFTNRVSEDGARYYGNLIDALLERGIEPVITLYHWELPQTLQDLGGWTNPLITDWFADYAKVVYSLYADRVKTWVTINEPLVFCEFVYGMGVHPPAILSPGIGDYLCAKHAMIAHAKAWRIYDEEFRPKYNGRAGLSNQLLWYEPYKNEKELAELARQLCIGIFCHPIYSKKGGWPPSLERFIAKKSKEEGFPQSRLPAFTEQEIELIKGTYDFLGLNFYTSRLVKAAKEGDQINQWPLMGSTELGVHLTYRPEWYTDHPWFFVYPRGFRLLLNWLKTEYGNVDIKILENGFLTKDASLYDPDRVKFYKDHLQQVLLAIYEDEVNITAYTAWSLIDNFEWTDGYDAKFGLYATDFKDPLRKRTPRLSAYYYANIIKHHSLNVSETYELPVQNGGSTHKCYLPFIYLNFVFYLYRFYER